MSLKPNGENSPNFEFGRDEKLIRKRFQDAGFKQVVMWRQQSVLELWNAERAVEFWAKAEHRTHEKDAEWFEQLQQKYQSVIDRGDPIGLEALIIVART